MVSSADLWPCLVINGQPGSVDQEPRPLGAWLPVILRIKTPGHLCKESDTWGLLKCADEVIFNFRDKKWSSTKLYQTFHLFMSCLVVCPPSKTDNFCGFLGFAFVMFHLHSSCYFTSFLQYSPLAALPPWIFDLLCAPPSWNNWQNRNRQNQLLFMHSMFKQYISIILVEFFS